VVSDGWLTLIKSIGEVVAPSVLCGGAGHNTAISTVEDPSRSGSGGSGPGLDFIGEEDDNDDVRWEFRGRVTHIFNVLLYALSRIHSTTDP
jgi:hypothetical protein